MDKFPITFSDYMKIQMCFILTLSETLDISEEEVIDSFSEAFREYILAKHGSIIYTAG